MHVQFAKSYIYLDCTVRMRYAFFIIVLYVCWTIDFGLSSTFCMMCIQLFRDKMEHVQFTDSQVSEERNYLYLVLNVLLFTEICCCSSVLNIWMCVTESYLYYWYTRMLSICMCLVIFKIHVQEHSVIYKGHV